MADEVTRTDIELASARIDPFIRRTPVLDLGPTIGNDWNLVLKLENLQVTGSFKTRGAFNVLLEKSPSDGIVAASGGNFGKAVAHAAQVLEIPATIFVPENSPREKTDPIGDFGADVRIVPGFYDQALAASIVFADEEGGFLAHAYDQHAVVAGQGTVAVEIEKQVPGATTVVVPVGGGGLIGGIASWYRRNTHVVAVEPELCPGFYRAREQGRPVDVEVGGEAASSLGAQRVGDHAWAAARWIDVAVLVGEEAVRSAQRWLWDNCRLMAEPGSAVTIAALREGLLAPDPGDVVVAVISGGNVSS